MMLGKWLEKNGETQAHFAARVGLSQGRISQIVNGGRPQLHTALLIETATRGEVKPRDLMPAIGNTKSARMYSRGETASEKAGRRGRIR